MEKVKIPKEAADAIESLRRYGWTDAYIVYSVYESTPESDSDIKVLNQTFAANLNGLLQALVNGWEVDLTPEDMVKQYFDRVAPEGWKFTGDANDRVYIERDAIRTTCDLLGIKIWGVNLK